MTHAMRADSTELSSKKTIGDWKAIQPQLSAGADSGIWKQVLDDFYYDRLKTRYLDPIRAISDLKLSKGEGFAIVAIQCSLIEFLESCFQGINYAHQSPTRWWFGGFYLRLFPCFKSAPQHTYKDSAKIFISFLTTRDPFRQCFKSKALARDFYKSVRCGVLHESRTKGAWLVHDKSGSALIFDPSGPILYRDDFQEAIERFIANYVAAVPNEPQLQQAFIRKFDHLCV